MRATDEHGLHAYECGVDSSAMRDVGDGVLVCASCGHRTDATGTGLLTDGFDIRHRQWGLRGDPHVWAALRDHVAGSPTPSDPEGVLEAYRQALREVARIDLEGDEPVPREDFAHGGMSSGMVDVRWWRTQGIPLLATRAGVRRPSTAASPDSATQAPGGHPAPRSPRGVLVGAVVWLVVLALPAITVGGGAWLLYQRATGVKVEAMVLACETTGGWVKYGSTVREECAAQWTIDGQTVVGGYAAGEGASEVGETVEVTVRGDTAYSRSLALPIILIVLGLPFLYLVARGLVDALRRRRG